jgi:hypothetical protein
LQANVVVRLLAIIDADGAALRYDYPILRVLEMHGPSIRNEDFIAGFCLPPMLLRHVEA